MSITSSELPKIKGYSKSLHAAVLYEYIVINRTQNQISEAFSLDSNWTVSAIIRAYNFNREKSGSYQGGKDKGKFRGTAKELVDRYVDLHYPGIVNDDRISFEEFLEKHRKQTVVRKAAAAPAPRKPQPPAPPSRPQPVYQPPVPPVYRPSAAELFQRAYRMWQTGSRGPELIAWFKQAADLGHAEAQYNVGFCYENGYGTPQNRNKAMEWYGKSAERGFSPAVERLARHAKTEVEIDESLDVNQLIRLMGQAATPEEKFRYRQVIHEKMHNDLYGPRKGNGLKLYGEDDADEIREFNLMGETISYRVTPQDQADLTMINDHIKIYVPGDTLIIAKDYAHEHLSGKAISYAIEEDDVYLWEWGGAGTAVVFELASLLDEERNPSVMYLKMLRSCPDYLQEFELYGDKFVQAYQNNLNKDL